MLIKLPDDTIINWDNFYSAEITDSGDIAFYFRRGRYVVDVGDEDKARKILDDIMKAIHLGARTFEIKTNDNEATKAKGELKSSLYAKVGGGDGCRYIKSDGETYIPL